jgi:hypothetical protein
MLPDPGLVREQLLADVRQAIECRIVVAQPLYGIGAALF